MLKWLAVASAYAATAVLWRLAYWAPADATVGARAAAGWLTMMFAPLWLVACLIAIACGKRLGKGAEWLAWLPLAGTAVAIIAIGFRQIRWEAPLW